MWFIWTPESENTSSVGVENGNFLQVLFVCSILFLRFKWWHNVADLFSVLNICLNKETAFFFTNIYIYFILFYFF